MKPHENLSLVDMSGEEWVDAYENDGMYLVSNLGRVKRLQGYREHSRHGSIFLKEKIMKISINKSKSNIYNNALITLRNKSYVMSRFIYRSFYPKVDFEKYDCIMHINKDVLDNRLENLKYVTRTQSRQRDMVKSSYSIIATEKNMEKLQEKHKEILEEKKKRTHITCSKCGKVYIKSHYKKGTTRCKPCSNKYYVKKRKEYIYTNKTKTCRVCGIDKKDKDFPKYDTRCKKCSYEVHKAYQIEQRETLGDWYVKEYGKFNYSYKEFPQKLIDELRAEIIEKRKPAHIFEGKKFKTKRDFAKYINKKYNIPITTVEYRLLYGHTEKACTLTRKEFIKYNKEN